MLPGARSFIAQMSGKRRSWVCPDQGRIWSVLLSQEPGQWGKGMRIATGTWVSPCPEAVTRL